MIILGIFISAYLIGSVPFGLILSRLAGYGDIRKTGSGNIGATNVLRTGSKALALLTLLLDGLKGSALMIIFFMFFSLTPWPHIYFPTFHPALVHGFLMLIGLFGILGHCFPVWLKFRGGKGVATTLGVLIVSTPITGLVACIIWLMTAIIFRYSSLSALVSVGLSPLASLVFYGFPAAAINLIIALLVILKHRENIRRLRQGEESKINFKKKDTP